MNTKTILVLLIPFLGTALGGGCVYLMKDNIKRNTERALLGFASGVMVAASIWSLMIPSLELAESWIPGAIGFWVGTLFLLLLDSIIPHLHLNAEEAEGPKSALKKSTMMVLAVTLHNIPEGMAFGVVMAGFISGNTSIGFGAVIALALGIAIQNFPEGAIISLPLKSKGETKNKSFIYGALSGIVEPIAALVTIYVSSLVVSALPYFLSFACGAMMYVVVEELIPEMSRGEHSNIGVVMFSLGFTLMMALDVALG